MPKYRSTVPVETTFTDLPRGEGIPAVAVMRPGDVIELPEPFPTDEAGQEQIPSGLEATTDEATWQAPAEHPPIDPTTDEGKTILSGIEAYQAFQAAEAQKAARDADAERLAAEKAAAGKTKPARATEGTDTAAEAPPAKPAATS